MFKDFTKVREGYFVPTLPKKLPKLSPCWIVGNFNRLDSLRWADNIGSAWAQ